MTILAKYLQPQQSGAALHVHSSWDGNTDQQGIEHMAWIRMRIRTGEASEQLPIFAGGTSSKLDATLHINKVGLAVHRPASRISHYSSSLFILSSFFFRFAALEEEERLIFLPSAP